jgi:hypothetical protein
MMSDEELAALGEDMKKNGETIPVLFWNGDGDGPVLIDGRNRLEAAERIGIGVMTETFVCKDPVTHIITLNIRRRHLSKQQQADLIVAAMKAGEKLRQVGEVSDADNIGGRGKKNPLKEKAVAAGKEHGIGERTIERAIAKAKPESEAAWDRRTRREWAAKQRAKPVVGDDNWKALVKEGKEVVARLRAAEGAAEFQASVIQAAWDVADNDVRRKFLTKVYVKEVGTTLEAARAFYVLKFSELGRDEWNAEVDALLAALRVLEDDRASRKPADGRKASPMTNGPTDGRPFSEEPRA